MSEEELNDAMQKMDDIKLCLMDTMVAFKKNKLLPQNQMDWRDLLTIISKFIVGSSDKKELKVASNKFFNNIGIANAKIATEDFLKRIAEKSTETVEIDAPKLIECAVNNKEYDKFVACLLQKKPN